MIVQCENCNVSFDKKKSLVERSINHFCSRECQHDWRTNRSGTIKNPKGKTVECETCGAEMYLYPSEIGKKRFCSRRCKGLAHAKERSLKLIVNCSNCGNLLEKVPSKILEHTFCNAECMGAFYSKKGTKEFACDYCKNTFRKNPYKVKRQTHKFCSNSCRSRWISENLRDRIVVDCANCGNVIEKFPHELKRSSDLFCSKECKALYQTKVMVGENNHNWRGGHDNYRGENWNIQRKRALERDGYSCTECNVSGEKTKLMVHHKIPFRFFDDYRKANRLSNLQTLCNSCHSSQKSHYWTNVPNEFQHLL